MTTMVKEVYEAFKAANISEEQASAAAQALSAQVLSTGDLADVVRNSDLDARLTEFEARSDTKLAELEARIDTKLIELEARLNVRIDALKAELPRLEARMTKWMAGAMIAQAGLIVALVKFL